MKSSLTESKGAAVKTKSERNAARSADRHILYLYLSSLRPVISAFVLFFLLFFVSFLLFRLPAGAVLYPAALCVFFGAVFLFAGFLREKHRCDAYRGLLHASGDTEALPQNPRTPAEEVLCEQIAEMRREAAELHAQSDASYREMTDYYTVWVHQIKTPIASMKLNLQNEDSALSRRLSAELFRIEQYVGMVLAYLRLDTETKDYVFREYALDGILRAAVRKFAPEFILRHLPFSFEPTGCTVVTDEKWLSFVVEQLLSNALKYTREGSIRVGVRDGHILYIADTGIGIAQSDLPRIFERGFTGANGRTEAASSGIGLYLCSRICKNLGIGLGVTSEVGHGTEFTLDLSQHKAGPD